MKKIFKEGDGVVKARPYNNNEYCKCGGDEDEVPIGTLGKVTRIDIDNDIHVDFENGKDWSLDKSELDFVKGYKGKKIKPKHFLVMQKSCNNFVGAYETLEEAKKQMPPQDDTNKIYKLVAEAVSETRVIIETIK